MSAIGRDINNDKIDPKRALLILLNKLYIKEVNK